MVSGLGSKDLEPALHTRVISRAYFFVGREIERLPAQDKTIASSVQVPDFW